MIVKGVSEKNSPKMKGQPVCDIQIVYLTKSDLNAIDIGCKGRTFCFNCN